MTTAGGSNDYSVAWKSLPRQDRTLLVRAAMSGHRSINRWDAAITLWWTQRELRIGMWRDLILAVGIAVSLAVYGWGRTGDLPTSINEMIALSPLFPVIILIPVAASTVRRPRLRRSAQLNAAVLAGKTFEGPPDPHEAERLLALARKEGWFRGTRPQTEARS